MRIFAVALLSLAVCYTLTLAYAGTHKTFIEKLQQDAENGNSDAQFILGERYANGFHVEKNESQAAKWWQKSAEQGNLKAQIAFCQKFSKSDGELLAQAARFCKMAADAHDEESGSWRAQLALADLYEQGKGVPQDYTAAAQLWAGLAANENTQAQIRLGKLLLSGQGTPKDTAKAEHMFMMAAERGVAAAQVQLAQFYLSEDGGKNPEKAYFWLLVAGKSIYNVEKVKEARALSANVSTEISPERQREISDKAAKWTPSHMKHILRKMGFPGILRIILVTFFGAIPLTALAILSRRNHNLFAHHRKLIIFPMAILYPFAAVLFRNAQWRELDSFFEGLALTSNALNLAWHLFYIVVPGILMFLWLPVDGCKKKIFTALAIGVPYLLVMIPAVLFFSVITYCSFNPKCVMP